MDVVIEIPRRLWMWEGGESEGYRRWRVVLRPEAAHWMDCLGVQYFVGYRQKSAKKRAQNGAGKPKRIPLLRFKDARTAAMFMLSWNLDPRDANYRAEINWSKTRGG